MDGWTNDAQMLEAYEKQKKNQYGKYLKDVLEGKFIEKRDKL